MLGAQPMTSHTNIKYFADIWWKGLKIVLEISMISISHLSKIIDTHCTCLIEKSVWTKVYMYHVLFYDCWDEKVRYINYMEIEAIITENVRHPHRLPVQKFGHPHL